MTKRQPSDERQNLVKLEILVETLENVVQVIGEVHAAAAALVDLNV
jgi:hypothetical protein